MKRVPADLRDVSAIILQAIRDTESGDLEPNRAQAIATLSRAYVAVHDSALVDARIRELEERLNPTGKAA